jgi:hypothetical protein
MINIIIIVLAAVFLLAALVSAIAGLRARSSLINEPYGVGRQESARSMKVSFIRAAVFGVLALILFGVYGLRLGPDDVLSTEPGPDFTPPATALATATNVAPTATLSITPSPTGGAPTATANAPSATTVVATATTTLTPTVTPTPVPTALVTSEVGLYLRDVPGGEAEIELLPVGTELVLLAGSETVDGAEWQEVRAPSGNEGWVAVEFIEFQQ